MEFESIIVAAITGICAVIGQYLIARKNRQEDETKQAVKDAIFQQRLENIERKLDEHNGYAQRFEEVAVSLAELRTELHTRRAS